MTKAAEQRDTEGEKRRREHDVDGSAHIDEPAREYKDDDSERHQLERASTWWPQSYDALSAPTLIGRGISLRSVIGRSIVAAWASLRKGSKRVSSAMNLRSAS